MIKMYLRCLALVAALCMGWGANAQVLDEYVYSTGIDSTKWITLTDYTDLSAGSSGDSWRSSVLNIGFTFPFGNDVYTQYSVNSDGNLRLGSTITGTNNYATPFSSSAANINNPKINFFGCDGYLVSGTHFVHAQTFGDTLLVVEYCLGPYNSSYRNNQFHWQVHLYNSGKIEAVFASESNLNSSNSHYMGMCIDATDGWIINSSGVASHFTNGTTTTSSWANTTWPTPYTYYTFEIPVTTCPRPTHITTRDITPTTATITFQPVGSETSWLATITPAIMGNNEFVLTDTVWNLSTLTPNTEYLVSVRAICGVGDTSNAIHTTFHTPCVALTTVDLPYTEDFESYGSGSTNPIDFCWTKGTNSTTAYPYPSSTAAINGERGLYFYGYKPSSATGTPIYSYAALPELASSVDVSGLTLRFNAKRYTSTTVYYRSLIRVGVMTDPANISTFELVEEINLTPLSGGTVREIDVDFSSYNGNGKYIALYAPYIDTVTSYSYNYVYVDDVELLATPVCQRPTSVTARSITTNSASIIILPAGTETSWQGTISDGNMSYTQILTDTVWNLSMLTPNTEYTMTVRAICGIGDTSEARTSTFHTDCVALTTADLPYTEDFEAYGSGSNYPISFCWTKGTSSSTAYPYPSSSAAINGERGLFFYGYKPSSTGTYTYSYAALPELASSVDISGLTLRFNAKRYTTTTVYYRSLIRVGVMTDPTDISTFELVEEFNLTPLPSGAVSNIELDLNNYSGNGKYIALYVPYIDTITSYSYNYVYVDDVELLATPVCHRPTAVIVSNITTTTATVSWTPASPTDNLFVVAYGTGTNPNSMITVRTTDQSVTLTGLVDATTYNVFVRTICAPNDESEWSIMTPFTTNQIPYEVTTATPFIDHFEEGIAWVLANGSNNKWYIGTAVNHGGEHSLYISNDGGVSNAYGISSTQWSFAQKSLSMAAGDYVITFDWAANGESNYDYLRAFLVPIDVALTGNVSPTGDSPYNFRSVTPTGWIAIDGGSKLNLQTSWQNRTDTVNVATAGNYNLVFLWTNDNSGGSQPPAAVDNVNVVVCPSSPQDVTVSNITNNSATINWTGNASSYVLWYYGGDTEENTITTSNTSYTLTGLSSRTEYTVRVKSVYSTNEESAFSQPISFTTQCEPFAVPYTEDFENPIWAELPDCWTKLGTGDVHPVICGSCADTENVSLHFCCSPSDLVVLPAFNVATNLLEMSMWTGPDNGIPEYGTFSVGYVTDASNANTFVAIETYSYDEFIASMELRTISFTSAPANARLALLHNTNDNANGAWFVDDIDVHPLPNYMSIEANKWYAIASPTHNNGNDQTLAGVTNLTAGIYDLYGYDEANGAWVKPTTVLEQGRGYIYRHADDTTRLLTFSGEYNSGDIEVALSNECADYDLQGFNLIGNPYPHTTTIDTFCYTLTPSGTWEAHTNGYDVPTGKAVLVHASIYGNAFSFGGFGAKTTSAALAFTISGNGFEDVAYAMFGKGDGMPKIGHLTAEAPALSIPVDGKKYAIATIDEEAEGFNLDFRAVTGSYTLTFNPQHITLGYLHLVDKIACREIDLLQTPTYTFNATGNDARRFSVKLKPDPVTEDHFARWNGEAWVVEGTGTLQVFDMLGRKLLSRELKNSTTEIRTSMFPSTGVYVLHFGTESQKIVVK